MPRPRKSDRTEPIEGRILVAATELFAGAGYDGVSLSAIATAVGIRAQSLSYHVGTKEQLYSAVVERFYGSLVERLAPTIGLVAEGTGRTDGAAVWSEVLRQLRALPALERDLLITIISELVAAGRAAEVITTAFEPVLDTIEAAVCEDSDEGAPVREALALLLFGAILSMDSPRISPGLAKLRDGLWGNADRFEDLSQLVLGSLRGKARS